MAEMVEEAGTCDDGVVVITLGGAAAAEAEHDHSGDEATV